MTTRALTRMFLSLVTTLALVGIAYATKGLVHSLGG